MSKLAETLLIAATGIALIGTGFNGYAINQVANQTEHKQEIASVQDEVTPKKQYTSKKKYKFNPNVYIYGQMYREYLTNGNKTDFTFETKSEANKYFKSLITLKNEGFIKRFDINGNEITIKGFNTKKVYNEKYCNAIKRNLGLV